MQAEGDGCRGTRQHIRAPNCWTVGTVPPRDEMERDQMDVATHPQRRHTPWNGDPPREVHHPPQGQVLLRPEIAPLLKDFQSNFWTQKAWISFRLTSKSFKVHLPGFSYQEDIRCWILGSIFVARGEIQANIQVFFFSKVSPILYFFSPTCDFFFPITLSLPSHKIITHAHVYMHTQPHIWNTMLFSVLLKQW